jgi:PAP2 superfamily
LQARSGWAARTAWEKTFWQAIDSSALGAVSSEALKHIFTRSRPDQSNNPNLWFQGNGHYSFPSGEVTAVTAITTPFVFEYAHDYPAVYALLLLPAYDSVARMVQAHWQTDVLAGVALGRRRVISLVPAIAQSSWVSYPTASWWGYKSSGDRRKHAAAPLSLLPMTRCRTLKKRERTCYFKVITAEGAGPLQRLIPDVLPSN